MKRYSGIDAVRPIGGARLEVTFKGGWSAVIDLARRIQEKPALRPLLDPALFATARVAFWGSGVAWGEVRDQETGEGEIDIAGDLLWRLAMEQAGETMPTAEFRAWRQRHGLSLTAAAAALGLSRRLVAYYDSGERPIPKTIRLATRGHDVAA